MGGPAKREKEKEITNKLNALRAIRDWQEKWNPNLFLSRLFS